MKRVCLCFLFCFVNILLFSASYSWRRNGTGTWQLNGSWTPSGYPNAINDVAAFGSSITSNATIQVNASSTVTVGTTSFDSELQYTISTSSGSATLAYQVSSGVAQLIVTDVNGVSQHSISSAMAVSLISDLQMTLSSTANFVINGQITGAGSLVKTGTGSGSLVLNNGANNYNGTTTIQQGNLTYNVAGCIPTTSAVTVGNGSSNARLIINASMTSANALAATVLSHAFIAPNETISTYLSSLSGSGMVALATGTSNTDVFTISGSTSTTFSGSIEGGSSSVSTDPTVGNRIIKGGTSTLTLSGTSDHVSRTFISQGVIEVQNGAALGSSGSGSAVYVQATTNQGSLYVNGNGLFIPKTLFLNGAGYASNGALHNLAGSNIIAGDIQIGWSGGLETASDVTMLIDPSTDLAVSGSISGTNQLTLSGGGTCTYEGTSANTLSGTTILNNGTTLQLAKTGAYSLVANATANDSTFLISTVNQVANSVTITLNGGTGSSLLFEQSGNDSFGATVTGMGNVIKSGSGKLVLTGMPTVSVPTAIDAGTFLVDGVYKGMNTMTVASGATLGGTGTIEQNTTIYGTLSPGDSIGTITFVGNVILASGSTLYNEVSSNASDLVDILGSLTIQPNTILNVNLEPGIYSEGTTYKIINTTDGVSEQFSILHDNAPLFDFTVTYTSNAVYLTVGFAPLYVMISNRNAAAVARCLTSIFATTSEDIAFVQSALRFILQNSALSLQDLIEELLRMQPSAFTSLAIDQEYNTLYVSNAILERLDLISRACNSEGVSQRHFWISPLGGYSYQENRGSEPGYHAYSTNPGIVMGVDNSWNDCYFLGGSLGVTNSHLHWKNKRGTADIQSIYAALYGKWAAPLGYIESVLMGAVNFYTINRRIPFFSRYAHSHHHGEEGSLHVKAAGTLRHGKTLISPFGRLDYIYIHEEDFRERGALSINLFVEKKNSNLLVSELGIDIAHCFFTQQSTLTPFIQLSAFRESRFKGKTEQASLNGLCHMIVYGINPSRTLGGLILGLDTAFPSALSNVSCSYQGKYGNHFQDHSLYLEFMVKF